MTVSDFTAILTGSSWNKDPAYGRTVLTYSMPSALPAYIASSGADNSSFLNSFQALTGAGAATARAALNIWENAADIQLVEVDRADADIILGLYDITLSNKGYNNAYAFYPRANLDGYDIAGDVFMGYHRATDLDFWLHETGHSLGLAHPHDGQVILDPGLDNSASTVMSYNRRDFNGTIGTLDRDAMNSIYGGAVSVNALVSEHEVIEVGSAELFSQLRDFDGNVFSTSSSWMWIGTTDVQGDGDAEHVFVNANFGRWATMGPDQNGIISFENNGAGGDTRVVGVYIDPLVDSGVVVKGGEFDSQRRFGDDLKIGNIGSVLGSGDYDGDGRQEMYFGISDGSSFLHACRREYSIR